VGGSMINYLLVKYDDVLAQKTGFIILKDSDWFDIKKEYKEYLQKYHKSSPWRFGVGTDEDIEYNYESWLQVLHETKLSEIEAESFVNVCKRANMTGGYNDKRLIIEEGYFPLPEKYCYSDDDLEESNLQEDLEELGF
jgi:hypothetical protein